MTFEEKLAAQGRKMDVRKAKLDDAISARKQIRQEKKELEGTDSSGQQEATEND